MHLPASDDIVAALTQARRTVQPVAMDMAAWLPDSLDAAYALQRAAVDAMGGAAAFKVSALDAWTQAQMGVQAPVAGALPAQYVMASPAVLDVAQFRQPLLECEFAWELAHDLPARVRSDAQPDIQPYTRDEVEYAIAALRIAVEVCDTRLPARAPLLAQLADGFNNGAFVVGPACVDWRALDFAAQAITLRHNGVDLAHGTGGAILNGDPVAALVLMANLQPSLGGLRAGQIVTTGTCTTAVALPGAGEVEADFGALGCVRLRFNGAPAAHQQHNQGTARCAW